MRIFILEASPGGSDDESGSGTTKLGHTFRGDGHIASTINKAVQVYF